MADPVDGLIKVAVALVKHVGTALVVGFALIFLSVYLFDISKDVTPDDPGLYWFSRIGVPVLFLYGIAAITVHWWRSRWPEGRAPVKKAVRALTGGRDCRLAVGGPGVGSMIEIESLDVSFDDFHAVRDVGFAVERGEAFGLVGESGSGKTTVLKAIAGLIEGWQGAIRLGGEALSRRRDKRFHRRVQMVFQDPYGSLHPRHTVDRTLAEPVAIHGLGDASARVERTLRAVGLGPGFRYRYPHQLSGGQRQRVAIARALMLEPEVLLLDEPTSSLDVSVQAEILNLLQALRQERGLTFLFVSHNLSVIAHMCDRLAIMNGGRIIEEVPTAHLSTGTLEQAYSRQLLRSSEGYDRQLAAALVDPAREA